LPLEDVLDGGDLVEQPSSLGLDELNVLLERAGGVLLPGLCVNKDAVGRSQYN
jgi:hypothetical protein